MTVLSSFPAPTNGQVRSPLPDRPRSRVAEQHPRVTGHPSDVGQERLFVPGNVVAQTPAPSGGGAGHDREGAERFDALLFGHLGSPHALSIDSHPDPALASGLTGRPGDAFIVESDNPIDHVGVTAGPWVQRFAAAAATPAEAQLSLLGAESSNGFGKMEPLSAAGLDISSLAQPNTRAERTGEAEAPQPEVTQSPRSETNDSTDSNADADAQSSESKLGRTAGAAFLEPDGSSAPTGSHPSAHPVTPAGSAQGAAAGGSLVDRVAGPNPLVAGAPQPAPPSTLTEIPNLFVRVASAAGPRGERTAVVRLMPPELGSIRIRIQVTESEVRAFVETDQAETRDALRQMREPLARAMAGTGLSLEAFEVDTDGRGSGFDPQSREDERSGKTGTPAGSHDRDSASRPAYERDEFFWPSSDESGMRRVSPDVNARLLGWSRVNVRV